MDLCTCLFYNYYTFTVINCVTNNFYRIALLNKTIDKNKWNSVLITAFRLIFIHLIATIVILIITNDDQLNFKLRCKNWFVMWMGMVIWLSLKMIAITTIDDSCHASSDTAINGIIFAIIIAIWFVICCIFCN